MKVDCSKAENFIKELTRMCKHYQDDGECARCPMIISNNGTDDTPCVYFWKVYPREAVEIVQRWSNACPQETRKEAFFKAFPKITINRQGYPVTKPCPIFGFPKGIKNCFDCTLSCNEQWDKPVEESVK